MNRQKNVHTCYKTQNEGSAFTSPRITRIERIVFIRVTKVRDYQSQLIKEMNNDGWKESIFKTEVNSFCTKIAQKRSTWLGKGVRYKK